MWFITGSRELYGEETLNQVRDHSRKIVAGFNENGGFPGTFVWKPVLTSSEQIKPTCMEANAGGELHRACHLDAHLLSGPDVAGRPFRSAETAFAPAHPVQPGNPLVGYWEDGSVLRTLDVWLRGWMGGPRLWRTPPTTSKK